MDCSLQGSGAGRRRQKGNGDQIGTDPRGATYSVHNSGYWGIPLTQVATISCGVDGARGLGALLARA